MAQGSGRWALIADIGGTRARFATCALDGSKIARLAPLRTRDFPTLGAALGAALHGEAGRAEPPEVACLALAAPITGDRVDLTNARWSFTAQDVKRASGASRVLLVNDFEALARVLPHLRASDLSLLHAGAGDPCAPRIVVGPGTGLGAAGLVRTAGGWQAIASEGGHMSFGARDDDERCVYDHLSARREHISVERVLSGGGLEATHRAFGGAALSAAQIVADADKGEPVARRTLAFFAATLARFAGDMALTLGARGGVYLGGGIAPRILRHLDTDAFREAFCDKGRMSAYLSGIPVAVITAPDAGVRGAAAALADAQAGADVRGAIAPLTPAPPRRAYPAGGDLRSRRM